MTQYKLTAECVYDAFALAASLMRKGHIDGYSVTRADGGVIDMDMTFESNLAYPDLRELILNIGEGGDTMAETLEVVPSSKAECCTPSAEELELLRKGDYQPEELWGGSRPTCPKCINAKPKQNEE